jgi:hypothetical protein
MKTAIVAAILLLACTTLGAQWPNHPTAGVPKKTDGSPNLSAPVPRTSDGKPDLSGLWELEKNRPCPPDGCPDMEVSQEFVNIGWTLKGGLPYQPWAAALVKARRAENGKDDPGSHCRPIGIVKLTANPFLRKFLQLPGLMVILNERDAEFRQIFTDGRALPPDPLPTPNGYSVGKWEGDTLVVQTIGMSDGQWLDRFGSPLTEGAKITERFRRLNYGKMEIEITVDDAKAYTKPWSVKVTQLIAPDTEMMDYFCMENEKDAPHLVGK